MLRKPKPELRVQHLVNLDDRRKIKKMLEKEGIRVPNISNRRIAEGIAIARNVQLPPHISQRMTMIYCYLHGKLSYSLAPMKPLMGYTEMIQDTIELRMMGR